MPAELAEHVDKVLGTDGFFRRRCEDVRRAKRRGHASYFERVLEAEKHAKSIEEWCPTLIPGLLQTDAYARALVQAAMPLAQDEEVEEKVSARLARAHLFEDNHKTPMYWAILSEVLLRQPVLPRSRRPSNWSTWLRWRAAAGSFPRFFRGTVGPTRS